MKIKNDINGVLIFLGVLGILFLLPVNPVTASHPLCNNSLGEVYLCELTLGQYTCDEWQACINQQIRCRDDPNINIDPLCSILFNGSDNPDFGNADFGCETALNSCPVVCGNGIVDGSDVCDDGGTISGDGCSSSCTTESGFSCNLVVDPTVCTALCGDGFIKGDEECDDADGISNPQSGDGCSSTCKVEPAFSCTGEPSVCTSTCGNGAIDTGADEVCDGSLLNGKTCVTQGFLGGSLTCESTCLSFNTSDCTSATTIDLPTLPTISCTDCGLSEQGIKNLLDQESRKVTEGERLIAQTNLLVDACTPVDNQDCIDQASNWDSIKGDFNEAASQCGLIQINLKQGRYSGDTGCLVVSPTTTISAGGGGGGGGGGGTAKKLTYFKPFSKLADIIEGATLEDVIIKDLTPEQIRGLNDGQIFELAKRKEIKDFNQDQINALFEKYMMIDIDNFLDLEKREYYNNIALLDYDVIMIFDFGLKELYYKRLENALVHFEKWPENKRVKVDRKRAKQLVKVKRNFDAIWKDLRLNKCKDGKVSNPGCQSKIEKPGKLQKRDQDKINKIVGKGKQLQKDWFDGVTPFERTMKEFIKGNLGSSMTKLGSSIKNDNLQSIGNLLSVKPEDKEYISQKLQVLTQEPAIREGELPKLNRIFRPIGGISKISSPPPEKSRYNYNNIINYEYLREPGQTNDISLDARGVFSIRIDDGSGVGTNQPISLGGKGLTGAPSGWGIYNDGKAVKVPPIKHFTLRKGEFRKAVKEKIPPIKEEEKTIEIDFPENEPPNEEELFLTPPCNKEICILSPNQNSLVPVKTAANSRLHILANSDTCRYSREKDFDFAAGTQFQRFVPDLTKERKLKSLYFHHHSIVSFSGGEQTLYHKCIKDDGQIITAEHNFRVADIEMELVGEDLKPSKGVITPQGVEFDIQAILDSLPELKVAKILAKENNKVLGESYFFVDVQPAIEEEILAPDPVLTRKSILSFQAFALFLTMFISGVLGGPIYWGLEKIKDKLLVKKVISKL